MKGRTGTWVLGAFVLALGIAIGAVGMRAFDMRVAARWMAEDDVDVALLVPL